MDVLIAYINSLSVPEREAFALECKTTIAYLRKAASMGQQLSEGLCMRIAAASKGAVGLKALRSDVDWQQLRDGLSIEATENVAGQGVANV